MTLLENLGEQIEQAHRPKLGRLLDDSEGSRQSVQYLVEEYNHYLVAVLEATDDSVITKMFRPLEVGDEGTSDQAKLSEVRLAQSGLLSYLKTTTVPLGPTQKPSSQPSESPRNLFGMEDVPMDIVDDEGPWVLMDIIDLDGEDVRAFAETVTLNGDDRDPNAEQWHIEEHEDFETINGLWQGRYSREDGQDGWAYGDMHIREIGGWVHIFFFHNGKALGVPFLAKARREGNRLVGRYANVLDSRDGSPWVGLIVNNRRIDGETENGSICGRWDFRR